jgi:hypothetical protein
MAKISELTSTASLTGSEIVPIVQSSTTKSTLLSSIRSWLLSLNSAFTGNVTVGGTLGVTGDVSIPSINSGQLAGMRNRIINGDMRVSQRGTSGTVANTYTVDRWIAAFSGAAPTWTSTTAATGYAASASILQINGVAGNTGANFAQRIEAANCRDLAGQTVTISYWVYQTTGATINCQTSLYYANVADTYGSVTLIGTSAGTSVPTATWTKVTYTVAVPSAATTGLQLNLVSNSPAIVASQTLAIGNVQLELGSTATSFEQRSYGLELALCKRYLPSHTAGSSAAYFMGQCFSASTGFFAMPFDVQARVPPTGIQIVGSSWFVALPSGASAGVVSVAFNTGSCASGGLSFSGAAGLTAGNSTLLTITANGALLWTGCEL